ncbi:MAG: aminomethyl-transferring glycine dehydrogenase subunit GcvPB [Clostridiales bacterium]|nr:aminomethyl-transferring glycine dehydrogenase subunit GcvPB [Clostridiales bacterium]
MRLIFDKSVKDRACVTLPASEIPVYSVKNAGFLRIAAAELPEVSELDLVRHYDALSARAYGVDSGFYPLGSCTMKYNPKLHESMAGLCGFTDIHPLQDETTVQGALEVVYLLTEYLKEITGMDDGSLQPAAGAHGEFTSLLMTDAYFRSKGERRKKILVPDSAHGTNPASAAMAGFSVVNIPSRRDGLVDLNALRAETDGGVAALMLTNPNTLGLYEKNIAEIAEIIHANDSLLYYDGANLNAVMGKIRPGDMGFDIMHINLHKTFSAPHGGGGPGSGPVLCKSFLRDFLPYPLVGASEGGYGFLKPPKKSVGKVRSFYGNFLVALKAFAYIIALGRGGIRDAAEKAVLNANYMCALVSEFLEAPFGGARMNKTEVSECGGEGGCAGSFECAAESEKSKKFGGACMHEFVVSAEKLKVDTGVSALDIAKALIDYGMHPPTVYFPLTVHEALMFEPTETESKETIDAAAAALREIVGEAAKNPEKIKNAPFTAHVGRPDEVKAARKPVLAR